MTGVTRMTRMGRAVAGSIAVLALTLAACTSNSANGRTSAGSATQTASPPQSAPRVGVVHGTLLLTEPVSGRRVPWSGVVDLRGKSDYRMHVRRDGAFRLSVRPGSYVLTGRNPRFGEGAQFCRHAGGRSVTVRPGGDVYANVVCLTTLG
jgi:hypothetical protein